MKKYIIKNCPCYDKEYEECLNTPRDTYKNCVDIPGCLLKRIVSFCYEPLMQEPINSFVVVQQCIAREIVRMLEIEEVEG